VNGRVAALVLAAGASSRMGGPNKLLCEVDGLPMINRAVQAAVDSRCAAVVVVTGWQADRIEAALASKAVSFVRNPDYADGMSGSLRRGLASLPDGVDAVLIQLADMPWICAAHIDRLVEAFDRCDPKIVVPVRGDRRGHPVLWPRRFFAQISQLSGDIGARELLAQHASQVRAVVFDSDAIFQDIDTPEQLALTPGVAGAKPGPSG
jgi:molybdenum cofactor cytidylyltransferase